MKNLDKHLDEVWEQMIDERKESILLLQDDLDNFLHDYVKKGGDKSWGKIVIYENFDYHINLLENGEIPSYSDNPKKWYGILKTQKDYDYLTEYVAYSWLEDESITDDVLHFNGEYKKYYEEELNEC